ncbi:hypothetical protein SKAU_G00163580 [Synaphobranchus kaupii]|uniref:Uncharacterized protein n=1 Tax=Synaphobranchus kaupii TaxID=118154 RepID=A0A9Q1FJ63_SYNKA|nr:hypothetical protein SKAU_G00163580 [Synaphobranchus kaupii]
MEALCSREHVQPFKTSHLGAKPCRKRHNIEKDQMSKKRKTPADEGGFANAEGSPRTSCSEQGKDLPPVSNAPVSES